MSEPTVEYVEYEKPLDLGWQNSSSGWFHTALYGYYRVDLGDFVLLSPSGDPTPIEDEEFRAVLIETAEAARADVDTYEDTDQAEGQL